ncbi:MULTISPECIES: hypothetical protein [Bacillus]|uniref:Uncharacterized protein n=2 Tax=Bacillus thuringiensis TaxID=1428 RepID=A0AAP4Q6X3_BACTU|nr:MULTISPECIES: hypothetical protein [Bacillus]MEC0046411.1 hypothetical protein [Bacillus cereus]AFV21776.1 hypothetical protein BTB_502p04710 [Bacillus thuringiensis Bt407]EEM25197.1 hypothetical protein bthur0002_58390 [Bacillus thuringiensis Bt407]ERI01048.1 hypothetical protein BTCBT_002603 [Bacillus thuringiensis T01-328]MBN6707809.1 hypothetical protein [Bacillus thuringiensis]
MTKVIIEITKEQEQFLKEFANHHFPGAEANHATGNPYFVVQSKVYDSIPYNSEIESLFEYTPLVFKVNVYGSEWVESEVEAVESWFLLTGEYAHIKIESYEEMLHKEYSNPYDELITVENYNDYFQVFGVEMKGIAWRKESYVDKAIFFIKPQAEAYMKYQAHNLNEPRIYAKGPGYANDGDFVPFRNLLFSIGSELVKGDAENESARETE